MRSTILTALVLLMIGLWGLDASAGQPGRPARLFEPALNEIKGKVKIPILLPAKLPADIEPSKLVAQGLATGTGYHISLYYGEACGNACFAGAFDGSSLVDWNLPKTRSVKLKNGATARFLPVRCGGSCAPANLWWEQGGVMYQIQLGLDSKTRVKKQETLLLDIANSMAPVTASPKE